jgi:hypothetical protein
MPTWLPAQTRVNAHIAPTHLAILFAASAARGVAVPSGVSLALFPSGNDMETIRPNAVHFAIRAVLICVGALLLWEAPASVAGLVVMLVGLVCAVMGLTLDVSVVALEKSRQF